MPYGDSVGCPRISSSRRSTVSLITCSHRQASSCTSCQSRPITSTSRHSAKRCLRITRVAADRPGGGQLDPAVIGDSQQAVTLHPRDRLRDRRHALLEPLSDPGPQRDDAFFLELEHGPQIHLRGVDEVVGMVHASIVASLEPKRMGRLRSLVVPTPGLISLHSNPVDDWFADATSIDRRLVAAATSLGLQRRHAGSR